MADIWTQTATDMVAGPKRGDYSAMELTQAHLDRIGQVNPGINAVVQDCSDEALSQARAVDAELAAGRDPGLMVGVPVTIKVNVDQVATPRPTV